jgi:hypothetical protein
MSLTSSETSVSSSSAMTSEFANTVTSHYFIDLKKGIEDAITRTLTIVCDEFKLDKDKVIVIVEKTMPEWIVDMKAAYAREQKRKEKLIENLRESEKRAKGPHCEWESKKKGAKPTCGEWCEDSELASDGKVYCNRHRKLINNKHTCEWIKHGSNKECGKNISKKIKAPYSGDSEYDSKWLCTTHTKSADGAENRMKSQCIAYWGDSAAEDKRGTRCTHQAKDNGYCSRHSKQAGKNKNDEAKQSARQAAKKANKKKEESDVEESDKEEVEDKKTEKVEKPAKSESKKKSKAEKKSEKKKEKTKVEKQKIPAKSGSRPPQTAQKDTITVDFSQPTREPKWGLKKIMGSNGQQGNFMVDINSGLVCESDVLDVKKVKNDDLTVVGTWDPDTNSFRPIEDVAEAEAYAASLGLKLVGEDEGDEENEDDEEEENDD